MNISDRYLADEYRGRINRVMDHIEQNLDRSITLNELADVANFSKFHFSRIFWAMTGETPFEFLLRIRLEKAAMLLVMSPKESITEVSVLCGYSSLPVFSRNFRVRFSMSPSQWRKKYIKNPGVIHEFDSNNRQTLRNTSQNLSNLNQGRSDSGNYFSVQYEPLKWRTNMELNKGVEIKDFPKTSVAYVRHTGPYAGNEKLFEKLYGELFAWAGSRGLTEQGDFKTYNIYHDDPGVTDESKLRLSVGLSVPPDTKVDGKIGKMELEAGKYCFARFELTPMDYEKAWGWLFGEWFPESGYQPADGPCFEMCGSKMDEELHVVDICVPVKPM